MWDSVDAMVMMRDSVKRELKGVGDTQLPLCDGVCEGRYTFVPNPLAAVERESVLCERSRLRPRKMFVRHTLLGAIAESA